MTSFWFGVLAGAGGVAALILLAIGATFAVVWWASR